MSMMIYKFIILLLFSLNSFYLFSQEEKETVYLLFDEDNKDSCRIDVEWGEDGDDKVDGYKMVKKYFKEGSVISICDEIFLAHKKKDTLFLKEVENKLVDFDYIVNKHDNSNEFKHHVFKKIYFIEFISEEKVVIYEVTWNDERLGIIRD